MPCYHPIEAWRSIKLNPTGKRSLVFKYIPKDIYNPKPEPYIKIKCGQCVGCKLQHSINWATRCLHQASETDPLTNELLPNCFLTLTISDEGFKLRQKDFQSANKQIIKKNRSKTYQRQIPQLEIPSNKTLHVRDLQIFMKKLRKKFKQPIKFFQCGEYGEHCKICKLNAKQCYKLNQQKKLHEFTPTLGRPHYHSIIFNHDFEDKQLAETNKLGHNLYVSETLEGTKQFKANYKNKRLKKYNPSFALSEKHLTGLWPYGQCILGEVTFESSAYVARYCVKKINGKLKHQINDDGLTHYQKLDPETGELFDLKPEFTTMSNGIGKKWFKQYKTDVYPDDFVMVNGKRQNVPRYYDNLLLEENPVQYDEIMEKRKYSINDEHPDNQPARLKVRERIKLIKSNSLVRNHDQQES